MKEFQVAAQEAVDDTPEEQILEFSVAGQDFVASLPTTGQIALVVASAGRTEAEQLGAVFGFLRGVLQGDGYRRLSDLLEAGVLPFEVIFGGDDANPDGIVEWIVQAAAGTERPTKRSSGSSSSQRAGGPRSTGRSPGKGSIRSNSLPVAS
jgi:hypothetical protein